MPSARLQPDDDTLRTVAEFVKPAARKPGTT
jgi:hypothetical protein